MSQPATTPVLYSFRRCPYAMRARQAIAQAGIQVVLREVQLRNKPAELLAASAKGTVPVLVLPAGEVIEESLDIMLWALRLNDPDDWLAAWDDAEARALIDYNDGEFKYYLDRYKYADRYPEHDQSHYRLQGEAFLQRLEQRLQQTPYLFGQRFGLLDAAVAPFVRQFAAVDPGWFASAPYPALRRWLDAFTDSALFSSIMHNYQPWQPSDPPTTFPNA